MITPYRLKTPMLSIGFSLLAAFYATHIQAISLQDVYSQALKSDPLLQQASSQLANSKENIVQAKAALRPTVDGNLTTNWQDNSNTLSSNSKSYAISLNQPVYSPALNAAYNKVKIIDNQAILNHQISQQDLIVRSVNAYIEAMIAKSNLTTAQAQERAIKRRLERVNAEFEVGIIAITDVHEAQASYDNTKVSLIVSEGELQNSLEALQRLTGQPVFNVDDLDDLYKVTSLQPNDASYWVKKVNDNNLSILASKRSIESSIQDISIANSALKPSVNFQASHSRIDNSRDGFNTNNQVALVLSMPLYNGGSLSSKARQAVNTQDIEKYKHQDTVREITQQTRSLLRDIQTNVLAINARKQSIKSSKAALDAVSEGFKVGTRNIVDLLQAEQALFSAQNQFSTARLNHIRMLFNLKQQAGNVSLSDITELSTWLK